MDTPGHSDFGGEVERALRMVDGVLLLVDASEGPLPQTRYVLQKALQAKLPPIIVLNKIDRADARPAAVLDEIYDLFIDLDATEDQLDFPVLYTNAKTGVAHRPWNEKAATIPTTSCRSLKPSSTPFPRPRAIPQACCRCRSPISTTAIFSAASPSPASSRARCDRGDEVGIAKLDGKLQTTRITKLFTFRGLERDEAETVAAGDIVAVAGVEGIQIGESHHQSLKIPRRSNRWSIDEPTLAMIFTVNSGPLSGREGQWLTSRDLRDRLAKELLTNVSIRVEDTDTPEAFRVLGRGELQLAILIETMRREGYELMVGKPEIVVRTENGKRLEPLEMLVVDCPETFIGIVMETLGTPPRRTGARWSTTAPAACAWSSTFPRADLIGLRGQLLTDTRGTALIHSIFDGWTEYGGEMASRPTGALVADRAGVSTAFALWNLQERGELFIGPAVEVYEGMIVGENAREADMDVNVTKEKKQTNMRASCADEAIRLIPASASSASSKPSSSSPTTNTSKSRRKSMRLRKKVLQARKRPRRWQQIRASQEAAG